MVIGTTTTDSAGPAMPFTCLHSLQVHVTGSTEVRGSWIDWYAPLPAVPFLSPRVFRAVTTLELCISDEAVLAGSALAAAGCLRTLRRLSVSLPWLCEIPVRQFVAALGQLAELRELVMHGAQEGIGHGFDGFRDADWARVVAGWPHLRVIDVSFQLGLSDRAVPILGAACRQLTDVKMPSNDMNFDGLPDLRHGSSNAGDNVRFPRLKRLLLHSTGLLEDGTKRVNWSLRNFASMAWGSFGSESLPEPGRALAYALAERLRQHAPVLREFSMQDFTLLERTVMARLEESYGVKQGLSSDWYWLRWHEESRW
jgi:hypothetical protein